MVKINTDIEIPSSFGCLFSPDGKYIGEIKNEAQLYDVQIQIAKEHVSGYYIVWKDHTIKIDEMGSFSCWPKGYNDQVQSAFCELHSYRVSNDNKVPEVMKLNASKDWRHPNK